jgi:hypothetical protein
VHSTLLPWLQKGQQKTISSLSMRFFGAGFGLDFLFPMLCALTPFLFAGKLSFQNQIMGA